MRTRWLAVTLLIGLGSAPACGGDGSEPPAPPFESPGPGLIFSFPGDGQLDVPVHAQVAVAFSEAIDTAVLGDSCSASDGAVNGGLCLVGNGGPVAGQWTLIGSEGRAAEFNPTEPLQPGQGYRLFASPQILAAGAGNVSADAPIVSFATRRQGNVVGSPPAVVAINGDAAEVYRVGAASGPRFPLADFATYRLVFSEPIDETTAVLGQGIEFVTADGGEPVAGTILSRGVHLSFDPDEDLDSARSYELRITTALLDKSGEAAVPQSFQFSPVQTHSSGDLYPSVLDVQPGIGDANYPEESGISSLPQNNVELSSSLIGQNRIELLDGRIELELADPKGFGTKVPVVIRRGQSLDAAGLEVALGGVVNSGLQTGDIRLSFASDVTGFLVRNRFWPESTIPDNTEAPLQAYLTFDIAVSALDPLGNAVLTQSVLGVQATGIAEVVDGQLSISNVGVLDLDLLGIATAPTAMALSLSTSEGQSAPTDTEAPRLLSTYPAPNGELMETSESIVLNFNESVGLLGTDAVELRTDFDAVVPAHIRAEGSMVVITPIEALEPDGGFRVYIGAGLADLSGNSWAPEAADPGAGTGVIAFGTGVIASATRQPPNLVTVYPGAPCAVVGQGNGSRRCAGGDSGDGDYLPFVLPANHPIEAIFDEPMDPDSMVLGTACGAGAVRVESLSGTTCEAPVPGTLSRTERGLRFVPDAPWTPGQEYRLLLNSGTNGSCGADELCGANGLPLNSDPLDSPSDAGGPTAQFFFEGAPPSSAEVAVTHTRPIADRNGNATIDADESITETNRATVRLASVSGLVSSASFAMDDCDESTPEGEGCMYLTGDLVVRLEESQDNCSIDSAAGPITVPSCIPVAVSPGAIYGTELVMDASILGLGLVSDLGTGKIVLRTRQANGPIRGYIIEDSAGNPELLVHLATFMDAPDLSILGGLASHDIVSKPLDVDLRGPVEFRDDGRLRIVLRNEEAIAIEVGVRALGINSGTMNMEIGAGGMVVDFISRSARGGGR